METKTRYSTLSKSVCIQKVNSRGLWALNENSVSEVRELHLDTTGLISLDGGRSSAENSEPVASACLPESELVLCKGELQDCTPVAGAGLD
jgi:hypothetical protein